MEIFRLLHGTYHDNARFHALLGDRRGSRRRPSRSARWTWRAPSKWSSRRLCYASRTPCTIRQMRSSVSGGGVALFASPRPAIARGPVEGLWIQPAAGDAGGAVGAALATWHQYLDRPALRTAPNLMQDYLGRASPIARIQHYLDEVGAVYQRIETAELLERTVTLAGEEKVVGWFHGTTWIRPRALGGRSILAIPRSPRMQSVMNLKIKFRGIVPAVRTVRLAEAASEYFDLECASPVHATVAPVQPSKRREVESGSEACRDRSAKGSCVR